MDLIIDNLCSFHLTKFTKNHKTYAVKFDDHLATFLYENKSLRLEGMGTFTLDGKVNINHESDKEIFYPIEGLSFKYDPKSDTDDNLILFLVKRLGKIQPLVRSDLESYLSNIKQFINIGKPYTIEGIGTLSKTNNGAYEFTPGNFLPIKEELHPKRENEEHNYPKRNQSSAGKLIAIILIVVAALAALGGIGWGISNILAKQKNDNSILVDTQEQGMVDTLPQLLNSDISVQEQQNQVTGDSSNALTNLTGDSARFKMIFETTIKKSRADRRTYQLHALHAYTKIDTIHIADSILYRLYLPMKIKINDTTHIKDSLKIFFGGEITAERQ